MLDWIESIKRHLQDWQDERYLQKHGCANWKEFYYKYDWDINHKAFTATEFYKDYPFVYYFHEDIYLRFGDFLQDYSTLKKWCEDNCSGKWRTDILRGIFIDNSTKPQFHIGDLSGWDHIFFAFKKESDYIWFITRWG